MFIAKSDVSGGKLAEKMEREYATFEFSGMKILFCQLEIIEAEKLVAQRLDDILGELGKLKDELKQDGALLSVLDLEEEKNIFVSPDGKMRELLHKTVNVEFNGDVAVRRGLLMRKQIALSFRDHISQYGI